jgi:UTP--glucose-1-phosphate uridylyltransferase
VIDAEQTEKNVYLIQDFIEKPTPQKAPSNLVIAGRYLLTPDIFDYISRTKSAKDGEIQLTEAMRMMVKERPMYALLLNGKRCDIGNKEGFIKTNIEFALKRKDMAENLRRFIKELAKEI